jgi:hypothetical protein
VILPPNGISFANIMNYLIRNKKRRKTQNYISTSHINRNTTKIELLAGQHEKAADKSEPFSRNSNNSKELDQQRSTNQDCKFTKRSWARQEILRLLINRDRKRKLLDRINEQAVISERNFKTTGNASVPSYELLFGKDIKRI